LAAESYTAGWSKKEVSQKWRNTGQFSAALVRISDCWGRSV
jgi:hypothetical protein